MSSPKRDPAHTRYALAVLAIVLAGAAAVFRADLFAGADLFFKAFRDTNPMVGWYPWARFNLLSFGQELFPLWNPYSQLGTPHLAHYQSSVLSPLFLPLLILPFELAVVPYLLLRLGVAGLGAYLFSRRIGLSRPAGALAAIAFGLSGYLIQYVNNIHIVIDLLIPYLLLAVHGLIRRRRLLDFLILVLVTVLVLLGGQPSAALVTIALGYGYALTIGLVREGRSGSFIVTAGAGVIALLISLPQLLPFLELIPQGWTFHHPGFGAIYMPPAGMVTMIAPGFFGTLDRAREVLPLAQIAPYLGAGVVTLALVGLMRPRTPALAFLAASVVVCLGLITGAPPFNLAAQIPGLGRVSLLKYLQPLLAFGVAILAGHGLDEIVRRDARVPALAAAAVVIAAAAAAVLGFGDMTTPTFGWGSAGLAAVMALATAVIAVAPRGRPGLAGASLVAIVWIELVFASSVNRPLMERNLAREDFSAIKEICSSPALTRCSFADDVLIPNMALAAPVFDIGIADALLVRHGVDLVSAVVGYTPETLQQNFMKYHALTLPYSSAGNRRGHVMGVSHYLSRRPLPENRTIDAVLKHGRLLAPGPRHSMKTKLEIDQDLRDALFAHPPCRWDLPLDEMKVMDRALGTTALRAGAGLSPRINDAEGDGVWFVVAAQGATPGLLWARYLDPRRQAAERSWISLDLTAAGPDLALVTHPNDSADNDWAAWGDLRLGAGRADEPARMVGGVRDYETPALPRAFLATDPAGAGPGEVEIESYGLQRVRIAVRAGTPGTLVLADAYYPGWRAWVEGEEQRIGRVNVALRAVKVPAGESEAVFRYEPDSFRIGLWSCLAALVFTAFAVLRRRFF